MELNLKTRTFTLKNAETNMIKNLEVSEEDLSFIFRGMRPRLMDFDDFCAIRTQLKKELKQYLKGEIIHLSRVTDEVWYEYCKDMEYKPIQKGKTYVKNKE